MFGTTFILTWLYGLIIMTSFSYLSFHVMEAWVLRHTRKCLIFGLIVAGIELTVLTLFAYHTSTEQSTGVAMMLTSFDMFIAIPLVWVIKKVMKIGQML